MNIIRQPFRYQNIGVVYWLIGINLFIFALMFLLKNRYMIIVDISGHGHRYRADLLTGILSMIPGMVLKGWIWTFVTYMFVHGGISHILFNMLALFIFGVQVEREMGSREFLFFYLVTGALAGVFSFCVYYFTGQNVILMGASGAIFAVELAFAVFFPHSIIYIWGILPLRAPVMVLGFTALELIFSITGRSSGVAHLTHLAGFGFAWMYLRIRLNIKPWDRLRSKY